MQMTLDFPNNLELGPGRPLLVGGVPEGLDGLALGRIAERLCVQNRDMPAAVLHVARDDQRLAALEAALKFFVPVVDIVALPAWDCVPYDRVSPIRRSPAGASPRWRAWRSGNGSARGSLRLC